MKSEDLKSVYNTRPLNDMITSTKAPLFTATVFSFKVTSNVMNHRRCSHFAADHRWRLVVHKRVIHLGGNRVQSPCVFLVHLAQHHTRRARDVTGELSLFLALADKQRTVPLNTEQFASLITTFPYVRVSRPLLAYINKKNTSWNVTVYS